MTKLNADNVIVRETASTERNRAIIVELHPKHIVLRLKGLREQHMVAYDALLWKLIKNAADRHQSERLLKKAGR
jgi:hypothetical protein